MSVFIVACVCVFVSLCVMYHCLYLYMSNIYMHRYLFIYSLCYSLGVELRDPKESDLVFARQCFPELYAECCLMSVGQFIESRGDGVSLTDQSLKPERSKGINQCPWKLIQVMIILSLLSSKVTEIVNG